MAAGIQCDHQMIGNLCISRLGGMGFVEQRQPARDILLLQFDPAKRIGDIRRIWRKPLGERQEGKRALRIAGLQQPSEIV